MWVCMYLYTTCYVIISDMQGLVWGEPDLTHVCICYDFDIYHTHSPRRLFIQGVSKDLHWHVDIMFTLVEDGK